MTIFKRSPTLPKISTIMGSSTSIRENQSQSPRATLVARKHLRWGFIKRSTDCSSMLIPSANRKTPLKNPPRSCPRCHPKENAGGTVLRSETCEAKLGWDACLGSAEVGKPTSRAARATEKPMRSLSCCVSGGTPSRSSERGVTDVVEGVCNERQGAGPETNYGRVTTLA